MVINNYLTCLSHICPLTLNLFQFYYFSIVEMPLFQSDKAAIWHELSKLNLDFQGVSDHEHKSISMLLWQHRLMLAHDKNATRLLQLTCSQGFYIHMDDYTLPGWKFKNLKLRFYLITHYRYLLSG
jgi:hypothetical protein